MQESAPSDLRQSYFQSLREEIKATKARIFFIIMTGILGAPVLTYFAMSEQTHLLLLLAPFLVMVLLVLYYAEQNMVMRAGRYIRENLEHSDRDWEHWLSSVNVGGAERQLVAMFTVVAIIFYVILLTLAVDELMNLQGTHGEWFRYYFLKHGVMIMYAIGTVWVFFTLARFWHSAVSTSD